MKAKQFAAFAALLGFLAVVSLPTAFADENRRHDGGHTGGQMQQQRDHGDRGGARDRQFFQRRDYGDRGGRVIDRRDRRMERRDLGDRGRVRLDRRDRGWRQGYVMDRRYHHDYYYPPRGYRLRELPRGYRYFRHDGDDYYFWNGSWYGRSAFGFVVVAPPFGLVIPILPSYYTTVWVGGIPYYYADDAYYVWRPDLGGYMVTRPPVASSVDTQPPAQIPSSSSSPDQFYVYPKRGQSPDQQSKDRYECHRWAVGQTGFDPSEPAGNVSEDQLDTERADYRRAITACLDARGYSVK